MLTNLYCSIVGGTASARKQVLNTPLLVSKHIQMDFLTLKKLKMEPKCFQNLDWVGYLEWRQYCHCNHPLQL